ncbi:MAG: hypothetical protein AABX88_00460 [Nanoarchaeota archaeon]
MKNEIFIKKIAPLAFTIAIGFTACTGNNNAKLEEIFRSYPSRLILYNERVGIMPRIYELKEKCSELNNFNPDELYEYIMKMNDGELSGGKAYLPYSESKCKPLD